MKIASKDKLVVELDGDAFLVDGKQCRRVARPENVEGDKWVVTDFHGQPPRLMTVDSPPNYADLVLQRRLQESGEVDGQAQVFSHWKVRRGRNATDVLFTALSGSVYSTYADAATVDQYHHLLFSIGAVLYGCLKHFGASRTTAVLFEHDRHVDYVIGRGGKVVAASRVSTYSTAPEAKAGLEETLLAEIRNMEQSEGTPVEQVVYINWVLDKPDEAKTPWLDPLVKTLGASLKMLKESSCALSVNERLTTSLPAAVRLLSVAQAVSPSPERNQYVAQRWAPAAAVVAAALVLGAFGVGTYYQAKASTLSRDAHQFQQAAGLADLSAKGVKTPDYSKTLKLATTLDHLRSAPSFEAMLSDLSAARGTNMRLSHVHIGYGKDDAATIEVSGIVFNTFPQAKEDHLAFLARLRNKGYEVVKSTYSTDVQQLNFSVTLKRSLL